MKSNALHFIFACVIACGLCLDSYATGAKTNIAEKAVAASAAKIAAEKDDAEAQFRYAEMLRDGRGVAKNVREAVAWMRKAADGGLAAAQCQMGLFYMNGLGVDRDEEKAVEWLEKAAAQNHIQAQYNLGVHYARFADEKSQRLAVKWLGEAAGQDYADAQYNLAKLYLNPHHPASRGQNAGRRAISLLRFAAAQGHAGAKKLSRNSGWNNSANKENKGESNEQKCDNHTSRSCCRRASGMSVTERYRLPTAAATASTATSTTTYKWGCCSHQ